MYDLPALKRRIEKEGIDATIRDLSATDFDDNTRSKLIASKIIIDGCLNLSLIYSLATPN